MMDADEYHFHTHWVVQATPQEVCDILMDAAALPRWWPAVYLSVRVVDDGGPAGMGRMVSLKTKGFLPYHLHWSFRVTESRPPHGFTLEASGDLEGTGVWRLEADGRHTHVHYDWTVRASKPLLRRLSPLARPIFEWNHGWAMARGEESLRLELLRRRAVTPDEMAAVPPPPQPMPEWPFWVLGAALLGWLHSHLPRF